MADTINSKETGRLIYIEPNDIITTKKYSQFNGNVTPDNIIWNEDEFNINVDLQAVLPQRDDCGQVDYDGAIADGKVRLPNNTNGALFTSFLSGMKLNSKGDDDGKRMLTDNYTDISYSEIKKGNISGKEYLGIKSINISFNDRYFPVVVIKFVDVRGYSLMMPAEQDYYNNLEGNGKAFVNFYKSLFNFPYPRFLLTVKGFLGTKVTFSLAVEEFKSELNGSTGDFEVTVKFIGYVYGFYTDIQFNQLLAAPYIGSEDRTNEYWENGKSEGIFVYDDGTPMLTFLEYVERYIKIAGNASDINSILEGNPNLQTYNELLIMKKTVSDIRTKVLAYEGNLEKGKIENLKFYGYIEGDTTYDSFFSENHITDENIKRNQDILYICHGGTSDDEQIFQDIRNLIEKYNESVDKIQNLDSQNINYHKFPVIYRFGDSEGKAKHIVGNNANNVGNDEDIRIFREYEGKDLVKTVIQEDLYYGVVKGLGLLESLIKGSEMLSIGLDGALDKVEDLASEELTARMSELLGFVPNVRNFYRMLFAHLDCFMNSYYNVLDKIKTDNRKLSQFNEVGITTERTDLPQNVSTEMAKEYFVPPYPTIFKGGTGDDKNTLMYPGEEGTITTDLMPEIQFVEDFIKAILSVSKEINMLNELAEESNGGSEDSPKYIPTSIFDIFHGGTNPYKYCDETKDDITPVIYMFMLRAMIAQYTCSTDNKSTVKIGNSCFSVSDNYFGTLPKLEAFNYSVLNGNKLNSDIVERLKGLQTILDNGDDNEIRNYFETYLNDNSCLSQLQYDSNNKAFYLKEDKLPVFFTKLNSKDGNISYFENRVCWGEDGGQCYWTGESSSDYSKMFGIYEDVERIDSFITAGHNNLETSGNGKETNTSSFSSSAGVVHTEIETDAKLFFEHGEYTNEYSSSTFINGKDGEAILSPLVRRTYKEKNISSSSVSLKSVKELIDEIIGGNNSDAWFYRCLYMTNNGTISDIFKTADQVFTNRSKLLSNADGKKDIRVQRLKALLFLGTIPYNTIKDLIADIRGLGKNDVYQKVSKWSMLYLGGLLWRYGVQYGTNNDIVFLNNANASSCDARSNYYEGEKNSDSYYLNFKNGELINLEEFIKNTDWRVLRRIYLYFTEWVDGEGGSLIKLLENASVENGNRKRYNDAFDYISPDSDLNLRLIKLLTGIVYIFKPNSPLDENGYHTTSNKIAVTNQQISNFIKEVLTYTGASGDTAEDTTEIADYSDDENNGLISKNIKAELYYSFKQLYDKWLCSFTRDRFKLKEPMVENSERVERFTTKSSATNATEYSNFLFVDSFYRDIGGDFYLNPQVINDIVMEHGRGRDNGNVMSVISDFATRNDLLFIALPYFTNFYDKEELMNVFTPHPVYDNSIGIGNTYICMYTQKMSDRLSDEDSDYSNNGLDLAETINTNYVDARNFFDTNDDETDKLNIVVPAFGVTYARQNQSIFKSISLSMDNPKITDYSAKNLLSLANGSSQGDVLAPYSVAQDIFSVYSNRSYQCTVEMMGCMNIMPMMYFQLNNVPMFKGAYLITNVSHNISQGDMTTSFVGTRVSKNILPLNRDVFSLQTLFSRVMKSTNGNGYSSGSGLGDSISTGNEWSGTLTGFDGLVKNEKMKKVLENVSSFRPNNEQSFISRYREKWKGSPKTVKYNGKTEYVLETGKYCGQCVSGPTTWYGRAGKNLVWWGGQSVPTFNNTHQLLEKCGFVPVWHGTFAKADALTKKDLRPGDIMTLYTGTSPHQHGEMWTGKDWRSDCIQLKAVCYNSSNQGEYSAVLWRCQEFQEEGLKVSRWSM